MNIFRQTDYRKAIKGYLLNLKKIQGTNISFSSLAKIMKVQHTYLSTVLAGNGHLNADQVFAACQYLNLSLAESEFLQGLHEFNRSVFAARRTHLKAKLDDIIAQNLTTRSHVGSPEIKVEPSSAMTEFYLDPNAIFVHMFLTVEHYRRHPDKIRDILRLSKSGLETALRKCEQARLIARSVDGIEVLTDDIHLGATSSLLHSFQMALRMKSMEFLTRPLEPQDYSLSVLYSASIESQIEIKEKFLQFLKWVQTRTQSEPPNAVFQMNFDLLKWSR
ncbi:MAG: DUF4423 domain-containing protein [Proteobacteria bacterium]|nr:DUF4423 domain-containing protein [Pseudomonadota bacterium]